MKPTRLLLIPSLLLAATACADDSSSSANIAASTPSPTTAEVAAPTSAQHDPETYCRTTRRLEKAGQKAFAGLERNATRADFEAAERSFILHNADLLNQLVAAASPDLSDDVETFLAAMRQRGGLEDSGVTQRQASRAEKRIRAFEKEHC